MTEVRSRSLRVALVVEDDPWHEPVHEQRAGHATGCNIPPVKAHRHRSVLVLEMALPHKELHLSGKYVRILIFRT